MNWKTVEANCWGLSSKCPGSRKWMWDSQLWQPCNILSTFPSVSHSVTAGHDSLFVIVFAACMRWAGLSPCPGILLPSCICETFRFFVSFIWHLSSCFISICSFFPAFLQQHKNKCPRLTGYCLQINHISFSLPAHKYWWERKFLWSLGKTLRGNNIDAIYSHSEHVSRRLWGVKQNMFWVKLLSLR